jgi:ribonuclease M5
VTKLKIKEAVVVEGKYDKIKLSSLIDGLILETHGFQIFRNKEQLELLRRLADSRGLLILTDSDSAGFLIRNFLKSAIDPQKIKHAYIPDIFGKEKRKPSPGKEGKLGVEGIPVDILRDCLKKAGVESSASSVVQRRLITKTDLFLLGLSGGKESANRRHIVQKTLNLPEHLSSNSLVDVLNSFITYDDFCSLCRNLF